MNKPLKNPYKASWDFLYKDMKFWILGSLAAFILLIIFSDFYMQNNPDTASDMVASFQQSTEDIAPDGNVSVVRLFLNNLRVTAMAIILGFIPFLFLPGFILISNSAIIGAVIAFLGMANVSVAKMIIFGILPHGIFEIPALILGFSMGMYLCYCLVKRICESKYNKGCVVYAMKHILLVFIFIAIPLLIIAAAVETYITPALINQFVY